MSCKPDLSTLISEIEWLVKDHSGRKLEPERPQTRAKGNPLCEDDCYTMKMTLEIFVKLHQMLHNYIGLANFSASKSRDYGCLKTPFNEALDVAVRAMISAMQTSVTRQPSSTPGCLNCIQTSHSVSLGPECEFDKLPEIEEVDRKLRRLKTLTLESVENVEVYVKDILREIAKLPLTVMTIRLEALSSVVRNTRNKLTSCGRSSPGSLMGTQSNPISQIVSEFILEYGQTKSRVYPCRKICRFCASVICPMDRRRNIFCCEKARRLNFLWQEWIQQNSVKGVARWDEGTIMSILDSFKDTSAEDKSCVPEGACAVFCRSGEGRVGGSRAGVRYGEAGDTGKYQRGDANPRSEHGGRISSDFSDNQGEGKPVDDRLGRQNTRKGEGRGEIGSLERREKRDGKDIGKNGSLRGNQNRDKGKGQEPRSHGSIRRNVGEGDTSGAFYVDKKSRKKGFKKDADGVDFVDQEDSSGVGSRKKGRKDPRGKEGDPDPEIKPRGKSHRKKKGAGANDPEEFFDDQGIEKTGQPSRVGSSKKGRGGEKEGKDGQGMGDATNNKSEKGVSIENGPQKPGGREGGLSGRNGGVNTPGTKPREKYGEADGKRGSAGAEGRTGVKSGTGTRGDRQNMIEYRLSNELFIEMGWTLLPKDTVMRRVVEFQASLAKPHMNWFKNNRIHGKQYYTDNKKIFVNFLEDGSGHVYYPNGRTAIAAHVSKKGDHELYKVYAPGGRDVMGVIRLPWLMGVFDSMGNGVVYNEDCDVRLTYNQNGGVYTDNPAKVPFSWGWNNFQTFPIYEAVYGDPLPPQHPLPPEPVPPKELKNSRSKSSKQSRSSKVTSSETLGEDQAALQSHKSRTAEPVKVIPRKVVTPLKPICLKMNKYLSLRILDRKNINLQFFAGPKSVRIELGTEVDPNVQINSELVDRNDRTAKITNSRFRDAANKTDDELDSLSPDSSLIEIAKEYQHAKNEANSRHLMIAKYRPHLISSISQGNKTIVDN